MLILRFYKNRSTKLLKVKVNIIYINKNTAQASFTEQRIVSYVSRFCIDILIGRYKYIYIS